jgi:hypothetical protein
VASDANVLGGLLAAPIAGVGATVAFTGAGVILLVLAVAGVALVLVGFVLVRTAMLRNFDPAEPVSHSPP